MRLKKENISSVSVQFEKHQAERRHEFGAYAVCCGSCCCCCCLHSLGGLISAAAAMTLRKPPTGGSVVGCYWTVLTLLTVVILAWDSASAQGFGIFAALLFLPLVQLAASILTLIWIGARRADFSDRKASLHLLGRITVWSLFGAAAGLLVMFVAFKM